MCGWVRVEPHVYPVAHRAGGVLGVGGGVLSGSLIVRARLSGARESQVSTGAAEEEVSPLQHTRMTLYTTFHQKGKEREQKEEEKDRGVETQQQKKKKKKLG